MKRLILIITCTLNVGTVFSAAEAPPSDVPTSAEIERYNFLSNLGRSARSPEQQKELETLNYLVKGYLNRRETATLAHLISLKPANLFPEEQRMYGELLGKAYARSTLSTAADESRLTPAEKERYTYLNSLGAVNRSPKEHKEMRSLHFFAFGLDRNEAEELADLEWLGCAHFTPEQRERYNYLWKIAQRLQYGDFADSGQ